MCFETKKKSFTRVVSLHKKVVSKQISICHSAGDYLLSLLIRRPDTRLTCHSVVLESFFRLISMARDYLTALTVTPNRSKFVCEPCTPTNLSSSVVSSPSPSLPSSLTFRPNHPFTDFFHPARRRRKKCHWEQNRGTMNALAS